MFLNIVKILFKKAQYPLVSPFITQTMIMQQLENTDNQNRLLWSYLIPHHT